ncbi:MAG: hypothetical protein APR63_07400 [Desulfuromonas sp. SDB]|nr:MAG: hypothetical protein APR63_07400 [Desulfuromonas sp. SDB]
MKRLAINGSQPINTKSFPAWPRYDQSEQQALLKVLQSGQWGATKGNEVKEFEQQFADFHQAKFGIATTSGTTALSIALRASGIGPGDEVILPGYTFVASATSILDALAKPVFVDIDLDSFNIDTSKIEASITKQTKAIMPVHFGGRPADMDKINMLAQKYNLTVIEDACQAWGSKFNGKYSGSLGTAGCYSFQSSKNITAGEGGMILTNNEKIADLARSISNCGRNPDGLWYAHYLWGGNYRMTEFQGALLQVQLSRYTELHEKRELAADYLDQAIRQLEGYNTLSPIPSSSRSSWHIFVFKLDLEKWDGIGKNKIIEAIRAEGIPISPGYSLPVYQQPLFKVKNFGLDHDFSRIFNDLPDFEKFHLPCTEQAVFHQGLWLTQNIMLAENQQLDVLVDGLAKVYQFREELK